MVLQGQPCGRVGRCRGFEGPLDERAFFFFGSVATMKKSLVTCLLLGALLAACNKKKDEPAPAPTPTPEAPKAVEKPKAPEAPAPDPKLVERGAYLSKASGCVVCHTAIGPNGPDTEHAFAGGLEMPDPMGTWRTPNITQDKGSGIGSWTDDQILSAIREGVRPDGRSSRSCARSSRS